MAVTAEQYILARYPAADMQRASALIPIAEEELAPNRYGALYSHAIGLLVLHWVTKEELASENSSDSGNAGTVTGTVESEKEGDLSIKYGAVDGVEAGTGVGLVFSDWATTSWGRELIRLTKATNFGAGIA